MHLLFFTLFFQLLFSVPVISSFSCAVSDPLCLDSFLGTESVREAFGDGDGDENNTLIFQNGILNANGSCAAMTVIFARGTAEPGNVGILAGPSFFAAIAAYMNGTNLQIQGVDYPADIAGFVAGGSVVGSGVMASLITNTLSTCPSTSLILSGYSQGAQLVHLATSALPGNTTSQIASIIVFGDPKNGTAIQGVDAKKVLSICHLGDDICMGGDRVAIQHLNYSADANAAAGFALGAMAGKGISSLRVQRGGGRRAGWYF